MTVAGRPLGGREEWVSPEISGDPLPPSGRDTHIISRDARRPVYCSNADRVFFVSPTIRTVVPDEQEVPKMLILLLILLSKPFVLHRRSTEYSIAYEEGMLSIPQRPFLLPAAFFSNRNVELFHRSTNRYHTTIGGFLSKPLPMTQVFERKIISYICISEEIITEREGGRG